MAATARNSKHPSHSTQKHVAFINKGPQVLNLKSYGSQCTLGLFVCQEEHFSARIRNSKVEKRKRAQSTKYLIAKKPGDLSLFPSMRGEYPYDVYDIREDEIDKQPNIPSSTA